METTKFEKGKLYRDTYDYESDDIMTTVLQYVHRKNGEDIFKYVSGGRHYMIDPDDGLIHFSQGASLIPHD